MIKDIFQQKEANKAGIYTVRFYVRGKPVYITIDDEVSMTEPLSFNPFAKHPIDVTFGELDPNNPTIWGMLLEKAYAKI